MGSARDITREKMFEARLKHAHDQFTRIMEHLTSGVFVVEENSRRVLFANDVGAGYFNRKPSELIGEICWEVFQEEQEGSVCDWCSKSFSPSRERKRFHCLKEMLDRDFEVVQRFIEWSDGRTVNLYIVTDITRRKQFMDALEKSEQHFRKLADYLPIPIIEYGLDNTISYANRAAREWFCFTDEQLERGYKIHRGVPPSERALFEASMDLIAQGMTPSPHDMHFVGRNGLVKYGLVYPAPMFHESTVVGVRTCFLDLTERHEAEAALRDSEVRFRTLFNGLKDAVFLVSLEAGEVGYFIEVNDSACECYGYSREEFSQMRPDDLRLEPFWSKGLGKTGYGRWDQMGKKGFESVHRTKDGRLFPADVAFSVFEFHGEKVVLVTARDITDRKALEAQRDEEIRNSAEKEKYALVGQVAGKMAHDFNNILGGIMGNAEISLMDCVQPEVSANLNIILQQTLRGRNLTKNLVAFAKDQEPREAYFSLNKTLDLVLNLMKKDLRNIKVVRDYGRKIPDLLADPGMVENVLVNLIQNAIHAMNRCHEPCLEVRTRARKQRLEIQVRDNGCGIPEKFFKDIYTPSFTLKGSRDVIGAYGPHIKGTGYGMANVKKYIEKHRGKIDFSSTEGEGTCFILSFPIVEKELTPREKVQFRHRVISKHRRILLVEDEASIATTQERILKQSPFEHRVTLAATGEEALDILSQSAFDLISLDYTLPGELNGLDVYRRVRERDPEIPILFISGNMEFLESTKDLGATDSHMDYLSKPCENLIYADTLNRLLVKTDSDIPNPDIRSAAPA